MSDDWIKMRCDLTNDPAVTAIAGATKLDRFGVVGRLHLLWSWADSHTIDGVDLKVGPKWIDEFVSKLGFAAAMCAAGWLEVTSLGVTFPYFERHNGTSAKRRAVDAKRKHDERKDNRPRFVRDLSEICPNETGPEKEKIREEVNLKPLDASHLVDFAVDAVKKPSAEKRINGKEYNAEARAIILFLNSKAGKRFPPSDTNVGIVVARLREGFTAAQIRQVIAFKVREWKGDEKMVHYLRPDTLFGRTKFSNYVGELGEPNGGGA